MKSCTLCTIQSSVLCKIHLIDLKKICKIYNIKKISNLNKNDIIIRICQHFAIVKIQNFIRKKHSSERICPISMEPVSFPLFAYKPDHSRNFIYYNLRSLCDYLITTGDFRDPKTRDPYSDETILKIDKLAVENKITLLYDFKTLIYASKNRRFYRVRKEKEETLLVLERCLDDIIDSMRTLIEKKNVRNAIYTLNSLFFLAFLTYFKRLAFLNKSFAEALMSRTIISVNRSVKDPLKEPNSNIIRDNIIQFLYQTKFDILSL